MSIFSGLSWENLKLAAEAAKNSPEGLAAVAIIALAVVAALAIAGVIAARHIGGFYAHVQQEEERQAAEEARQEAGKEGQE